MRIFPGLFISKNNLLSTTDSDNYNNFAVNLNKRKKKFLKKNKKIIKYYQTHKNFTDLDLLEKLK
jgi:hypothetical protein